MSGYGKSQEGHLVYEYATTRPTQTTSYAPFAQPSLSAPYPRASHEPSQGQMAYTSSSTFEPRDTNYHLIDTQSARHQLPRIISFSPLKASHGTKLFISIRTATPLAGTPAPIFSIMFYQKRCEATLSKLDDNAPCYTYTLDTDIPPYDSTGCLESQVPLMLNMEDEYGQSIGVVQVGDFTYADLAQNYATYAQPTKRKRSSDSEELLRSPAKRASQNHLRGSSRESTGYYHHSQHLPASPPTPNMLSSVPSYYPSGSYKYQPSNNYTHRPSSSSYSQLSSLNMSTTTPKTQPSQMTHSSYSPYAAVSQATQSPASVVGTPIGKPVARSPSHASNPTLIRTSTLPPTTPANPSAAAHLFNPYAMYPNAKAILKIEGDLDSMVDNWSPDEWSTRRRLVQFKRSQTGSTITATFGSVAPEERSPHSICISCIYWKEKGECFVTSVDTIYLLESLVAVRFTVEEKNRIRRNLEGFRPLTVSKVKADSEDFFKIIMGFPNPKPRNIEKDVKVFPWKILSHALKKIISKYSASYSSTAGALAPPVNYSSSGLAEAGTESHHTISPRHSTTTTTTMTPTTYQSHMASPAMKASGGLGRLSAGPPESRLSMSHTAAGTWQTPQHAAPQYSSGLSSYASGTPIDYAAFLAEPGTGDQSGASHAAALPQIGGQRGSVGGAGGGYGQRTPQL